MATIETQRTARLLTSKCERRRLAGGWVWFVLGMTLTGAVANSPAQAQYSPGMAAPNYVTAGLPAYEGFYGWASTAAEGELTGWSRLTRAWGQFNLLTAQARCYEQQAYNMALTNNELRLAPWRARKEAEQKVTQARISGRSQELAMQRTAAYSLAQSWLPQIEAEAGALSWPVELHQQGLPRKLETIDALLARWVRQDHLLSQGDRSQLKRCLNELQSVMRKQDPLRRDARLSEARNMLQSIDTLVFTAEPPSPKFAVAAGRSKF